MKPQDEFGTWRVDGEPLSVVYPVSLIERLAAEIEIATRAQRQEIVGVLFGTWESDVVRITASRPVHCESQIPFDLAGDDPALKDLTPVGFCRLSADGHLSLSDSDIQLWNCFFPERHQVVLIVALKEGKPDRAGFFVRPQNGVLHSEPSLLEFPITSANPHTTPVVAVDSEQRLRSPHRLWWIAACAAVMTGTFAYLWASPPSAIGSRPAQLALRLMSQNKALQATWNGSAPPLMAATGGTIYIQDRAANLDFALSQEVLRQGVWPIPSTGKDVRVRLELTPENASAPPLTASARYVQTGPPADSDTETLRHLRAQLQGQLKLATENNQDIENRASGLRKAIQDHRAARIKPEKAAPVPDVQRHRLPARAGLTPARKWSGAVGSFIAKKGVKRLVTAPASGLRRIGGSVNVGLLNVPRE